jgi:hypothetical protein
LVIVLASAAALLAIAWGAVVLRPARVKQPTLPGWPAAGSRAGDNNLRATAWRAWAARDPSVQLDRTAMLFAEDWREGQRTVVLLATPTSLDIQVAVVLVNGKQAERFTARRVNADTHFITEQVEANGQTAVLAVAPGLRSAVVTTAAVGAPRATETATNAQGGLLFTVPAGQYATRLVLKNLGGAVIADRVPGADSNPETPPMPLIVSESVEGGRRVQIRGNGGFLTCDVTLADPATDSPALVVCPVPRV